jgi:hypothetical protein
MEEALQRKLNKRNKKKHQDPQASAMAQDKADGQQDAAGEAHAKSLGSDASIIDSKQPDNTAYSPPLTFQPESKDKSSELSETVSIGASAAAPETPWMVKSCDITDSSPKNGSTSSSQVGEVGGPTQLPGLWMTDFCVRVRASKCVR